jgi:aromatic ring hydroxylase
METTFIQKIQENKASHYWYGGKVAEIKHKGFTFSIEAVGDMYATLFDEKNIEIAYIKDKNNGGWFDNEMSRYIKDDEMLYDLLDRNKLVFDYNNWWECFVIDDKGNFHDLMWVLDSINIFDALEEVKNSIDNVIKDIKGE